MDKRKTTNNNPMDEPFTEYQRKCKMTWAALIKCIYEVDPLKCPKCGEEMRVISFIEAKTQADVIKRILKHCGLPASHSFSEGRWKDKAPRPPPLKIVMSPPTDNEEPVYDYSFFDDTAFCDEVFA